MTVLRRLAGGRERRMLLRGMPSLSGTSTAAGVTVTPEGSLQISAVYACVTLIAETLGALPTDVFRRSGSRRLPSSSPVAPLLTESPNGEIDSGEFWRQIDGYMELRGNAYAYQAGRRGDGRPSSLWLIPPTMCEPVRMASGRVVYKVTLTGDEWVPGIKSGEVTEVPARDMLHFRNFGFGLLGYSPIALARQGIGITFSAEQYGARFFSQGAYPGGAVTVPGELSDEAYERLLESWKAAHRGYLKAYEAAILEGGATWQSIGLPPQDAQFLETRRFQVAEIARLYGVPPHMIGDVEKSTSWGTGIEVQGIGFVTYTLLRKIRRMERVAGQLLSPDEFFRFNVSALLRGDTKSRYEGYAIGRQWGFLSANDIAELEDREPIAGGDAYLVPMNMITASDASAARSVREVRAATMKSRHIGQHERLIGAYFGRQRESVGSRALDSDEWDRELTGLLVGAGFETAAEAASEVVEQIGSEFDPEIMRSWVTVNAKHAARSINEQTAAGVAEASASEDPEAALAVLFGESRTAQLAATRVVTTWNFGRHDAARHLGLTTKTWIVTSAKPRPSHAAMAGETVGIDEAFSNGGRWPGDPGLGVDEIAGCTCDLAF